LTEIENVNKEIEEINPKSINSTSNAKDPRETASIAFFKDINIALNNTDTDSTEGTNNFKGK